MKNGKLKIEKGIPVPEGSRHKSDLGITLKEMKIGESFLYPLRIRQQVTTSASRAGVKVTTRTVDDENIRVWRIK